MAITNFIPSIWTDELMDRWDDQSVLADTVTREYEGVASKGNVVKITAAGAVTIRNYKANGRVSNVDSINDTGIDLLIDQERDWAIDIDDVDATQAAGSLGQYTDAAADGMVADTNTFLASMLATNAGNTITPAAVTTGDAAFNLIADADMLLTEANTPESERVVVVNARFYRLLMDASSKLTSFDTSGDSNGLRRATVGELLGFRVIKSNALIVKDRPAFLAYHRRAAGYVSQIDNVETLRNPNKHGDIVRGLHVYGAKTLRANSVVSFAAPTTP